MRLFYASDTTPNAFLDFESNLWRSNLYSALIDLGHDVPEFQYDLRETFRRLDITSPSNRAFVHINRQKISHELLSQISAAHNGKPIDLFFSYFYDACVLPETIDEIKSMGIKTVNWYCNGSYQLNLVSEISPHYDWCLVPEKFRLDDYRAMGANPIYCQEAANPSIYKPYNIPVEFDVTFVGQAYGDRPAYIKVLLENGIEPHVWGTGWNSFSDGFRSRFPLNLMRKIFSTSKKMMNHQGRLDVWSRLLNAVSEESGSHSENKFDLDRKVILSSRILGPPLSDSDMIRMFSRSKINLGFSSCGETHKKGERILQVRLRDFEVPMSGGFYMVEYMEELEEFYQIGKEIVCYQGPEDLAQKIKYYLSHDEEREAIRHAGYRRCQRDHTWQKRLHDAFQEMSLG